MRTLILGAKGQLGRDLIRVFSLEGEAKGYDLPEVDITNEESLQPVIADYGPDLVINAAAWTDVDAAEDQMEPAFMANETGARNVADLAAYHHAPVVYYSTDYVFDGTAERPYTPDDPIAPLAVYGRSKAAGETATRRDNARHFIVRTAWLYGPGGNNFVEKMLRAAETRPQLKVVENEIGSPTHTLDLAIATRALAQTKAFGTYHAVNTGQCSRFEQAKAIFELAGVDVDLRPCGRDEFPAKAARPAYSVLDTQKLREVTGHTPRHWREALEEYMQRRKMPL